MIAIHNFNYTTPASYEADFKKEIIKRSGVGVGAGDGKHNKESIACLYKVRHIFVG